MGSLNNLLLVISAIRKRPAENSIRYKLAAGVSTCQTETRYENYVDHWPLEQCVSRHQWP
jgi:hypothetical protein